MPWSTSAERVEIHNIKAIHLTIRMKIQEIFHPRIFDETTPILRSRHASFIRASNKLRQKGTATIEGQINHAVISNLKQGIGPI